MLRRRRRADDDVVLVARLALGHARPASGPAPGSTSARVPPMRHAGVAAAAACSGDRERRSWRERPLADSRVHAAVACSRVDARHAAADQERVDVSWQLLVRASSRSRSAAHAPRSSGSSGSCSIERQRGKRSASRRPHTTMSVVLAIGVATRSLGDMRRGRAMRAARAIGIAAASSKARTISIPAATALRSTTRIIARLRRVFKPRSARRPAAECRSPGSGPSPPSAPPPRRAPRLPR